MKAPVIPEAAHADTCPVCGAVHGQLCGQLGCTMHGHALQPGAIQPSGRVIHTCPVQGCHVSITAPKEPPMTDIATRTQAAPITLMWEKKHHIAAVLPDHIDVKGFLGTAAAALYASDTLMAAAEKDPGSLVAALIRCASLGHRPGTDEFYLTPRGGKVLGIEGYRGIVERMYRSGAVRNVVVREVCANDRFTFVEGLDEKPVHRFGGSHNDQTGAGFFGEYGNLNRGEMVGVYAYAVLDTGAISRVVILTRDDVMAARQASPAGNTKDSPWNRPDGGNAHPEFTGRSMWWKTAARRLEPWVPTSAEYRRQQLLAAAEATRAALPSDPIQPPPFVQPDGASSAGAVAVNPDYIAHGQAQEDVRNAFSVLGVYDEDEQLNLTAALLGEDTILDDLAAVSLHDLQRVKAQVGRCEDIGQVHALIDRGGKPA